MVYGLLDILRDLIYIICNKDGGLLLSQNMNERATLLTDLEKYISKCASYGAEKDPEPLYWEGIEILTKLGQISSTDIQPLVDQKRIQLQILLVNIGEFPSITVDRRNLPEWEEEPALISHLIKEGLLNVS